MHNQFKDWDTSYVMRTTENGNQRPEDSYSRKVEILRARQSQYGKRPTLLQHQLEAASYRANNFNLLAASNLHLTKCNQFEQLKIGTYKSATWRFTSRESSNAYSFTKSISHTLLHEHELLKVTLLKDVQSSTVFNSLTASNLHLTMCIISSKIAILQTSREQQKIGT